jgi:hypothetical protein
MEEAIADNAGRAKAQRDVADAGPATLALIDSLLSPTYLSTVAVRSEIALPIIASRFSCSAP